MPDEHDRHRSTSAPRTSCTRGGSRKLGGKFDAVPGYHNYTWFKAAKAGASITGQCAELCGRNHADMIAARARPCRRPQFNAWLAAQKAADRRSQHAGHGQQRAQLAAQPAPARSRPPRRPMATPHDHGHLT